ncbi:MAG: beta-lactamase family protein [Propionibacteriaceae bacterium]|jgi:CubicO group peptidase (beta-lactamase class C family)|nr:beta-lactamase family protein [Propionibacteriaceae bacterium]
MTDLFEPVTAWADQLAAATPGFAAQLCVIHEGRLAVDCAVGVVADSVTGVYSSSKGVAAMVVALLVQEGRLDLDAPVARYWPEFAAAGKADILVRHLLSHQAGLPGVVGGFTSDEFSHSELAAARLAAAQPFWRPGAAFGYHGLTIGVFMEELVRRITGTALQSVYDEVFRRPHELDFFLGLPAGLDHRYRPLLEPLAAPTPAAAARFTLAADGYNATVFAPEADGLTVWERAPLPNQAAVRRAGWAAAGGVGSARGLAEAYAVAYGGYRGRPPLIGEAVRSAMAQEQVFGQDRVLGRQMAFGVVYMRPQPALDFGSYRALGHDGAGGAIGYYDPFYDVAAAYIPQHLETPGDGLPNALQFSRVVRSCLAP